MSKVAIVTGGARGIGRGCALELATRGYDIALVDLLEPEMARTRGEIEGKGRKALTYKADVSQFARAHEVVEDVARQWGHIDFLLNDAGGPNPKGILGLTRSLAKELGPKIMINAICPGVIETELGNSLTKTRGDEMKRGIMLNRLGKPADVAQLVAFLATSEPCFITGQHFVIDGFQWSC